MNYQQCVKCANSIDKNFLVPMSSYVQKSSSGQGTPHLRWMVEELSKPEFSEDKAMRWLGYIQGALVITGVATLDQMKEESRSAVHGD